MTERARAWRSRRWFLVAFAAIYAVWLVLGVVDNLVWMPQLIAPTTRLDEIYAVLARAGSVTAVVTPPVHWMVFWAVAGAIYIALLLPAHRWLQPVTASAPMLGVVGSGMVLFGAMTFFQWWSGFAMGMEVSDVLPPYVGNTTPFGHFCLAGGFLFAIVGATLWSISGIRAARRRRPGAALGRMDAGGVSS